MITLVAACDLNGVIGNSGQIPWNGKMPGDLRRFKELTTNGTVVMGRVTWESLPEKYRPLPRRRNIVLSRSMSTTSLIGAECLTFEDVIGLADKTRIFVIGGTSLYQQFLPHATQIVLTQILSTFPGDRFFPTVEMISWYDCGCPKRYLPGDSDRFACVVRDLRRLK